jgi:predicted SnoaL-like aldol condensation-catalyzing enzyme
MTKFTTAAGRHASAATNPNEPSGRLATWLAKPTTMLLALTAAAAMAFSVSARSAEGAPAPPATNEVVVQAALAGDSTRNHVTRVAELIDEAEATTTNSGSAPRPRSSDNKALVLKAFDTLFNKRDYVAAERYWSPKYIQHSAHIEPGREGLFRLIRSLPPTLKYEPGLIVAEGEFVIVHGRFSGHGQPKNWIAADIVRVVDGVLVEHWDVIEDEASRTESKSGRPMFGADFSE